MPDSTRQTILIITAIVPGLLIMLMGIPFIMHDRRIIRNCTERIRGRVIKYTLASRGPEGAMIHPPVVEYFVDGIAYHGVLKYSSYVIKRTPWQSGAEVQPDLTSTHYKLKANAVFRPDASMEETFPIGSDIDVYYNPQKPKQNYVLRFAKSSMGLISFLVGLGIEILMVLLVFLLILPSF